MSAAPIAAAGGRNQTRPRGCRIVIQTAVTTANARSIGRQQTSVAAVTPAAKNRQREDSQTMGEADQRRQHEPCGPVLPEGLAGGAP